jgi:cytochrome c oxidase assembly protein subunit 15
LHYTKALHRFALFTAFSTFCLIVAGGLVTSTQSGLAVPDWPLSYGQVMPPMVGGIFYEHTHRLIASFVGLLTIILAIWLWRKEERRWMKILGIVALGAVITQGILGGLTVLYLLPTAISVSHATLAQTFFSIVVAIVLFTSRWWQSEQIKGFDISNPFVFRLAVFTTLAVYLQLILGALMRHTHSGLAVPDFPLAYGQVFPSLSPEMLASYNKQLILNDVRFAADGPITVAQIVIHMLHRFWAVVVICLAVWLAVRLKGLTKMGLVLIGLVTTQIALGAFTVLSLKSVEITTAHVATGALLLASCMLVTLQVARITGFRFSNLSLEPTFGSGKEISQQQSPGASALSNSYDGKEAAV